jgi:hypothetical protein
MTLPETAGRIFKVIEGKEREDLPSKPATAVS